MSSRQKLIALALLGPVFLAACTNGSPSSFGAPDDRYFIGKFPVRVDSEYRHRYTCADGTPAVCECGSRLADCECTC